MGNNKHTKRDRGYRHETSLVKLFQNNEDYKGNKKWDARRLGGSSEGLPDVVAVNNSDKILITIEAKSRQGDYAEVPKEQIERCFKICDFFSIYHKRYVIFAFKFMNKTRDPKTKQYVRRELREYYQVIDAATTTEYNNNDGGDAKQHISRVVCTYGLGPKIILPQQKDVNLIIPSKTFESFKRLVKFLIQDKKTNNKKKNNN